MVFAHLGWVVWIWKEYKITDNGQLIPAFWLGYMLSVMWLLSAVFNHYIIKNEKPKDKE